MTRQSDLAPIALAMLATLAAPTMSRPDDPRPPSESAPLQPQATLEWKAAKEAGVYGYLIYRSEAREGPFLRIGSEIVHVSKEPGEVHSYRFVDTTVVGGRTYFYYLDKIATTGEKTRLSGVVAKSVPATRPES